MRIINKGRGTGKTTALMYTSSVTGYPILTFSKDAADLLKLRAQQAKIEMPEPLCVDDLVARRVGDGIMMENILVDETSAVLTQLLSKYNVHPVAITLTAPEGVHNT